MFQGDSGGPIAVRDGTTWKLVSNTSWRSTVVTHISHPLGPRTVLFAAVSRLTPESKSYLPISHFKADHCVSRGTVLAIMRMQQITLSHDVNLSKICVSV